MEVDALDATFRLQDRSRIADAAMLFVVDRELTRLERRCATLTTWLETNGIEAVFRA